MIGRIGHPPFDELSEITTTACYLTSCDLADRPNSACGTLSALSRPGQRSREGQTRRMALKVGARLRAISPLSAR